MVISEVKRGDDNCEDNVDHNDDNVKSLFLVFQHISKNHVRHTCVHMKNLRK